MRSLLLVLLAFALSGACAAKEAPSAAEDPAVEKRMMAIAETLRCLVCQNQTIADSHADLADDFKNQIREKIKAGVPEDAIIGYMVSRYGDFVLYRPPLKATTVLLWFGPFALLAAAFGFLLLYLRRRRGVLHDEAQLNEAQRARVREILGDPTTPA